MNKKAKFKSFLSTVLEVLKNTAVLCLITCVSGGLLGGVYTLTKEPRLKAEIDAKNKAYMKVLPDADNFEEVTFDEAEIIKQLWARGISESSVVVNEAAIAKNEAGDVLGYVITVTSKEGYGGDIKFSVGFNVDKTINGISILTISETAGLGMKVKENSFLSQFRGVSVGSFSVVTSGGKSDDEIDAVSGATISSKAITQGVNGAVEALNYVIKKGGSSNE